MRIRDSGIVEDAKIFSDVEDIASRTANAIDAFGNLTWTYCHGDGHGFNARITTRVFFDFDDGGLGYLAYDLSVFLWAEVSFGRKLTPMWDSFIEGYRAVRPIAPYDFEAAQRFVIVRHFWLMGEYASRTQEWAATPLAGSLGKRPFSIPGRRSGLLTAYSEVGPQSFDTARSYAGGVGSVADTQCTQTRTRDVSASQRCAWFARRPS